MPANIVDLRFAKRAKRVRIDFLSSKPFTSVSSLFAKDGYSISITGFSAAKEGGCEVTLIAVRKAKSFDDFIDFLGKQSCC